MSVRLNMTSSEHIVALTALGALLVGGFLPARSVSAAINEQVARINLDKATANDVSRVSGAPQAYSSRGKPSAKDNRPRGDPITFPKIDRRPAPWDLHRGFLESVPQYDPANLSGFQVDLRSYNLSRLDLREAGASLEHAIFDDRTIWPAPDRLPKDFDRRRIMELGKNPGLGVRSLHAQGITGRGVGIAIVDSPLLTGHQEYAEHLRLYEETNVPRDAEAHMHGTGVASIAVGKTVGVAPEADLHFIAAWPTDLGPNAYQEGSRNFAHYARAIRRILQINDQLPAERKIRVVSISSNWHPGQKGYAEVTQAVDEARAEGIFVVCSALTEIYGFRFHGSGRDPLSDPNDFASYRPPRWSFTGSWRRDCLLVPMDARTAADPSGKQDYVYCRECGWSWAIPYIAGVYALTAQVDPKITPERFWALALKTGRTIQVSYEGKALDVGSILDPARLIEAVRRGDLLDKAAVAAELAKYPAPSPRDQPQAGVSNERISEELAARIARLDIDNAGRKDVVEQLGKPESYMRGKVVLDANNLPSRYTMMYPARVQVIMSADRILGIVILAPGYRFRDKIEVGTTLEEVFQVLGPPAKTLENAKRPEALDALEDGVLYRDVDGKKGDCLYRSRSQGVALGFEENRVCRIVLLPKGR